MFASNRWPVYAQIQAERLKAYEAGLAANRFRPFVYPWDSLPALYLLLGVLFLPILSKSTASLLRWPIMALIIAHCVYICHSGRTIGLGGGYGMGLSACWGCIMSVALLFCNDIKEDFVRLEARPLTQVYLSSNGSTDKGGSSAVSEDFLRSRGKASTGSTARPNMSNNHDDNPSSRNPPYRLEWQRFPIDFIHRLDWTADLLTSFRGVGWNSRDPTMSKFRSLGNDQASRSDPSCQLQPSINVLRKRALWNFLSLALFLDVLKYLHSLDPYFLGVEALEKGGDQVWYGGHPILLRASRLTISAFSVYTTLDMIFQLCPLFFTSLPLLIPYPQILSITRLPLLTSSMYEPYWGPLWSSVAEKGLAGFWGRSWHQLFRYGITQPSTFIIKHYKLDKRSNTARMIQVLTSFALSGTIHACAAATSFPPRAGTVRPLRGPFTFFMLQGTGVLAQAYLTRTIKSRSFPLWLRRGGNFLFILLWAYYTGPLLASDFAACGIWLFEPLPISITKGITGAGWWRWTGRWAGWYSDPLGRWWQSGFAVY